MTRILFLLAIATIAIQALADNQCIRAGSQEIILYDAEQESCQIDFAPADPRLHWKFASANGQPSCWRDDENFVYVATNNGVPSMYPRNSIEDISACKKFGDQAMHRAVDEIWETNIEECKNFELPDNVAELACYGALTLAERFGDSDPRLLFSIDLLGAKTNDIGEAEKLLKRSMDIRQKYFPSDYQGLVSTLGGIGTLRKKQRNVEGAETAYLEAIRVGRKHLGDDHLEVIALTLLLGKMYLDVGMLPKAEEQLLVALASAESHRVTYLATAHSFAASSARYLADIYQKQSKGVEADRYREISLKHRQAAQQPVIQEIKGPSANGEQG